MRLVERNGTVYPMNVDNIGKARAALEAGLEATARAYSGHDPLGFVVSLNLKRRHLSESQRAMVAAKLATMRQGERTDIAQICAMSQDNAADTLQVSRRSVQHARKVVDKGALRFRRQAFGAKRT